MSEIRERMNMILSRLNELENTPSELLKDALLADLREVYDSVKRFELVESISAPEVVAAAEPEVVEKVEAPAPVKEEVKAPVVEEEPVEETPVAEKMEEEKPVEKIKPAPKSEPVAAKKPLIGKEEVNVEEADKKTLGGQLNRKPLEDLRSGIPLNEKFGIIRTLFKGNASDFGDAVLKLNNAANGTEMTHYLNLLQQRFGWDMESEAYRNFYTYVERKMLSLETSDANSDK